MKKVLKVTLVFAILLLCHVTAVKAATNEELIAYATKKFDVNGKTVELTAADKVKVQRYLNAHPVSATEADQIIAKIDEGVNVLRANNVTDPQKLSSTEKQKLLSIGQSAAKIAGAELVYNKDQSISIFRDGKEVERAGSNDLVQTGADYAYIVYTIAGVAVIATAVAIVRNSRKANA